MIQGKVLICGAGIVGLTLAQELLNRGATNITLLEKEPDVGYHASGRNSGVLHAGIYYAPDSLKARYCLRGNRMMKEYCRRKSIPVLETGKVIVAKNGQELPILEELYRRAAANGARVEMLTEEQLAAVEPHARTFQKALYSLDTAVVDPLQVIKAIKEDLLASGRIKILTGTKFLGLTGEGVAGTNKGKIDFDLFINAAGAYSDEVARSFEVGLNYRLIPFKGIYKKMRPEKKDWVKGNIYPVPDIRNPFLGVHFTRKINGDLYVGPTAIPALGRENYGIFRGMDIEAMAILAMDAVLFWTNSKFRAVAMTEPRKYFDQLFFADAKKLVKVLEPSDLVSSDKVGIRSQLVDWSTKELVMDFLVLRQGRGVHVLNAVSPAFTSSMAFAEHVVDNYILNNNK